MLHRLFLCLNDFSDYMCFPCAAQLPGTTQEHLQIFNIELKSKMKSHQMPEQVKDGFWDLVLFSLACQLINSISEPIFDLITSSGCLLEVDNAKDVGPSDPKFRISLVYRR